ncbi:MAG TPA: cation-translocating P-type ATPase [Thermoplasmata archaeon]|nr:cation-translocating P-type ATPase [Thermoplasmata archaeon]
MDGAAHDPLPETGSTSDRTSVVPALPLAEAGGGGLTAAEAAVRLGSDGPNELPQRRRRPIRRLLLDVLSEPLIFLLVAASVLYLLFGELRDALLLAASVGVIIGLDLYQETRAEHALEALESLSLPSAPVMRDGAVRRVPTAEIVRGDYVLLSEGSRVPADGWLRSGTVLTVDESALTGESVPVGKVVTTGTPTPSAPGGDGTPFVFAHTLVVRGSGWAEVSRTGSRTEVSRIASALATVETGTPLLRQQTRGLVRGIGVLAVVLTIVIAVVVGARSGNWILGVLAGTALAIGLLPEEIPIVLTVYSVLGARRMARRRALARRFGTIPTLGSITVLLTDKTGTLTENRMQVAAVVPQPGHIIRVGADVNVSDPAARRVLATAALANDPNPADPMEIAIQNAGSRWPSALEAVPRERVRHEALSRERLWVANIWSTADGGTLKAIKGAVESVVSTFPPPDGAIDGWEADVRQMAGDGLRVLAVAVGVAGGPGRSASPDPVARLIGLVGLADPLRAGVPEAVGACHDAGVRVMMITGDHPETARAVARAAGMARSDSAVLGSEIAAANEAELAGVLARTNVFARVPPEEKLRLVESLKSTGEVVAMTGDGINDAPALRAAHVGIAMGVRGTDVAREASSLILLDDSFPTIVEAIRTGRSIYTNMRKAIAYIVAVHVALAGMAILPVLLGLPILLFPVEIVFLELLIDPTASLVYEGEPVEAGVMHRPPRDPSEPLVDPRTLYGSLFLGAASLAATFAVYYGALALGHPADESRGLSFATLVVSNLSILLVTRSFSISILRSIRVPNPLAWGVLALGAVLLALALYSPALDAVFQFLSPDPLDLGIAVLAGVGSILWIDAVKGRWFLERSGRPRLPLPSASPPAPSAR